MPPTRGRRGGEAPRAPSVQTTVRRWPRWRRGPASCPTLRFVVVHDLGPLVDRPLLVIDTADAALIDALRPRLPVLPCVLVGVGVPGTAGPEAVQTADVLLTERPD